MKTLKIILVLPALLLSATPALSQKNVQIVKVKASPEDLVVGHGEILQPDGDYWVFSVQGRIISLQGLTYRRAITESEFLANNPQLDSLMHSRDFQRGVQRRGEIQDDAVSIYSTDGPEAMCAYLELQKLDGVVKDYKTKGTHLMISWENFEVPSSVSLEPKNVSQGKASSMTVEEAKLRPIRLFEESLVTGDGLVFGEGYTISIPKSQKEEFRAMFNKLMEEGEASLTEAEKQQLPRSKKFLRDVAGRR